MTKPCGLTCNVYAFIVQLGDFGLGFGLYFSTLRAIGYILFIAGLISVFNIYFFASGRYSSLEFEYVGLENLLRFVIYYVSYFAGMALHSC